MLLYVKSRSNVKSAQVLITMGLISDRRNKAKQAKNNEGSSSSSSGGSKMKKGLFGGSTSHMFPLASPNRGPGSMVPKYPPGYYTTPNHSSSWSHPGQPKFHPNVNPRYQTWVAPRKQPALGQLVMKRLRQISVTYLFSPKNRFISRLRSL